MTGQSDLDREFFDFFSSRAAFTVEYFNNSDQTVALIDLVAEGELMNLNLPVEYAMRLVTSRLVECGEILVLNRRTVFRIVPSTAVEVHVRSAKRTRKRKSDEEDDMVERSVFPASTSDAILLQSLIPGCALDMFAQVASKQGASLSSFVSFWSRLRNLKTMQEPGVIEGARRELLSYLQPSDPVVSRFSFWTLLDLLIAVIFRKQIVATWMADEKNFAEPVREVLSVLASKIESVSPELLQGFLDPAIASLLSTITLDPISMSTVISGFCVPLDLCSRVLTTASAQDQFIYLTENVYPDGRLKDELRVQDASLGFCDCSGTCGKDCPHVQKGICCRSAICRLENQCGNRPPTNLERGHIALQLVVKESPIHGNGVYYEGEDGIPSGTPILEILGEVLRKDSSNLRDRQDSEFMFEITQVSKQSERTLRSTPSSGGGQVSVDLILDPRFKGSLGRWVNSSCESNCRVVQMTDEHGLPVLILESTRVISPGEELCIFYGRKFFGRSPTLQCQCKRPNCFSLGNEQRHEKEQEDGGSSLSAQADVGVGVGESASTHTMGTDRGESIPVVG